MQLSAGQEKGTRWDYNEKVETFSRCGMPECSCSGETPWHVISGIGIKEGMKL